MELKDINPFMRYMDIYVVRALQRGWIDEAKVLFQATLSNRNAKGKDREDFINSIVSKCSNEQEVEA